MRTHRRHHGFTLVELIVCIVVIAILAMVAFAAWLAVVRRANENRVVTAAESYARELATLAAERSRHQDQSRSMQDRELVWEALGDLPKGYSVAIEGSSGTPVLLQRADGCQSACASGAAIVTSKNDVAAAPVWMSLARSGASVCVRLSADGWHEGAGHTEASRPNGLGACDDLTLAPAPQQAASAAWETVLSLTGAGGGSGTRYQSGAGGVTTTAGGATTTMPAASTTTTTSTVPAASWAASRAGAGGDDYTRELAVLADGGVIVAGEFQNSVTFGSTTLTASGSSDVFVAKLAVNGTWAWAVRGGGSGVDLVGGMEVSADGSSIAVAGEFQSTGTFGSTSLSSAGSTDAFFGVVSSSGTWSWATKFGGSGTENGFGVSWAPDGSLRAAGAYSGTSSGGAVSLTSLGGTDVFVAKLSAAGAWQWATSGGGTSADFAAGIDVDSDGSAVVAGQLQNAATFGAVSIGSNGSREAFVGRISDSGVWSWVSKGGGSGGDAASAVAILQGGGIVVTGSYPAAPTFGAYTLSYAGGGSDAFVAGLSSAGAWTWAQGVSTANNDSGKAVIATADGGAVVTGFYAGSVTLASTITASGFDAYVAGVTSNGAWSWSATGGEMGLAVASRGGVVMAGGALSGTSSFGATSLTSAGSYDAFVARITNGAWG